MLGLVLAISTGLLLVQAMWAARTEGATGELHLQATVNLATLTAEGTFVGTICGLS
jgi:hypothetical protein